MRTRVRVCGDEDCTRVFYRREVLVRERVVLNLPSTRRAYERWLPKGIDRFFDRIERSS